MSLASTSRALGAVSEVLSQQLALRTGLQVSVGKPEPEGANPPDPRLNVYLYQVAHDPTLRNVALDNGQRPPLWLISRYIMTAFDEGGRSDTADAQRLMGAGLRALQELNYLPIEGTDPADLEALAANPEPLKITFNEIDIDVLSKITPGDTQSFRFSTAFEVRPVLVAPSQVPSYSLLVGIDYSTDPHAIRDDLGIGLLVEPMLGLMISAVQPSSIEADEEMTITGFNLETVDLPARLGPLELDAELQADNSLLVRTSRAAAPSGRFIDPSKISAGFHVLTVAKKLTPQKTRVSSPEVVALRPIVDSVSVDTVAVDNTPGFAGRRTFVLEIDGFLLGTDDDDVFVAMLKDGATLASSDIFEAGGSQAQRRVVFGPGNSLPPGDYRAVVRVNGSQSRQSPLANVPPP